MSGVRFYRADKRDFVVGDEIYSAGEFHLLNPVGISELEEVFEAARPKGLPERGQSLFVFESLKDARKHWSKMADGKLYEVNVAPQAVLFRADMALVDSAYRASAVLSALLEHARKYWAAEKSEVPVIEVLVSSATVSAIVSKDQKERREYLKSWALVYS